MEDLGIEGIGKTVLLILVTFAKLELSYSVLESLNCNLCIFCISHDKYY